MLDVRLLIFRDHSLRTHPMLEFLRPKAGFFTIQYVERRWRYGNELNIEHRTLNVQHRMGAKDGSLHYALFVSFGVFRGLKQPD